MRFVAIEFKNKKNGTDTKGYLRIPENFNTNWSMGFRQYLIDTYGAECLNIYPLNVHLDSDTMGRAIVGYSNMEDDFNMALRSNIYYPPSPNNDNIRRAWSMLDPMQEYFVKKER